MQFRQRNVTQHFIREVLTTQDLSKHTQICLLAIFLISSFLVVMTYAYSNAYRQVLWSIIWWFVFARFPTESVCVAWWFALTLTRLNENILPINYCWKNRTKLPGKLPVSASRENSLRGRLIRGIYQES